MSKEFDLIIPNRDEYKKFQNIELEGKILIPPNIIKKLLNYYLDLETASLSQSINIITELDNKSHIHSYIYDKFLKKTIHVYDKYNIKKPIRGSISIGNYKFTLSSEESSSLNDASKGNIARLKYRLTWTFPSSKKGLNINLDFTFTSTVNDLQKNTSKLLEYKDKYFHTWNGKNKDLVLPNMQNIELELEYVGKIYNLTSDNINQDIHTLIINPILKLNSQKTGGDGGGGISEEDREEYYDKLLITLNKFSRFELKPEFKYTYTINKDLPKVRAITHDIYKSIYDKFDNYYVTEKLDGIRGLVYINGNELWVLTSELRVVSLKKSYSLCIFDAEIYGDNIYLFDSIIIDNINITNLQFIERYEKGLNSLEKMKLKLDIGEIVFKKFHKMPSFDERFKFLDKFYKKITNKSFGMDVDGLIFTDSTGTPYNKTDSYKWKPIEHTTIDFYLKRVPEKLMGKFPFDRKQSKILYILFCSMDDKLRTKLGMMFPSWYGWFIVEKNNTYPYPFVTSKNPHAFLYYTDSTENLDGKVCEIVLKDEEWNLVKIRTDRQNDIDTGTYFGNYYSIAENTYSSYYYPFNLSNFGEKPAGYFGIINDLTFINRDYNNKVKQQLISYLGILIKKDGLEKPRIIDMASGKGQDMFKYAELKPSDALFIDIDIAALNELVSRKNNGVGLGYKIHILQANLFDHYKDNHYKIKKFILKSNIIIMNFAFHYFCKNASSMKNLLMLIDELIEVEGYLLITGYDGARVHNLLSKSPVGVKSKRKEYTVMVEGVPKYSLIKNYEGNTFTNVGQEISVLLPFSSGDYYKEFLINGSYLKQLLTKMGFVCVLDKSFMAKEFDKNKSEDMTEDDKLYLSLYNTWIFKKKIIKKQKNNDDKLVTPSDDITVDDQVGKVEVETWDE